MIPLHKHLSPLLVALGCCASSAVGQTQFAEPFRQHLPKSNDYTWGVALGDVDGDGSLDLAVANWNHPLKLYVNDGKGRFTDATGSRLPNRRERTLTLSVALGDVDGDGDLDLVFGNAYSIVRNWLYLNDGKGKFTDVTASRLPDGRSQTRAVAFGDVDGDGDLDLICGNGLSAGQRNSLYVNDGKGKFTDATASRMPGNTDVTFSVALGDVDGDQDLDLICGNMSEQNRLYLNDGKGKFTDATASRLPATADVTFSVALGDVDGDQDLDLICGNMSEQNRLYLNDGKAVFAASPLPRRAGYTHSVALGDVDEDGDLDLICGNMSEQNRLYLNDGKGKFIDATAPRIPKVRESLTRSVALGDVDGDGDLDLICGNHFVDRLYLNRLRQVSAPAVPKLGAPYVLLFHAKAGFAFGLQRVAPYLSLTESNPPIRFPGWGAWGLGLVGLVALPPLQVPAPSGEVSIRLTIPDMPILAGSTLYTQAVVLHGLNVSSWRFSNVNADRIVR